MLADTNPSLHRILPLSPGVMRWQLSRVVKITIDMLAYQKAAHKDNCIQSGNPEADSQDDCTALILILDSVRAHSTVSAVQQRVEMKAYILH